MKAIYKFPLEIVGSQTILSTVGLKPLSVQIQNGVPCLWAEVNKEEPSMMYNINIFGTGHEVEEFKGAYVGTVQDGGLVWHFYIREVF